MDGKYYIEDGNGNPVVVDMTTWASSFEVSNRKVAKTKVGEVEVSTVFLGLNHQFGDGPPLLYETMVFGGPMDGEQERYSTRAEATEGHAATVKRVAGGK